MKISQTLSLGFGGTQLTDISFLRDLSELSNLIMDNTQVTDIAVLQEWANRHTDLSIRNCRNIEDAQTLLTLQNLHRLSVTGSGVAVNPVLMAQISAMFQNILED